MSMRDWIARGICEKRRRNECGAQALVPYGESPSSVIGCGCGYWEENQQLALAAMSVMREPTEAMVNAPPKAEAQCNGVNLTGEEAAAVWQSMIDAAMKEP